MSLYIFVSLYNLSDLLHIRRFLQEIRTEMEKNKILSVSDEEAKRDMEKNLALMKAKHEAGIDLNKTAGLSKVGFLLVPVTQNM